MLRALMFTTMVAVALTACANNNKPNEPRGIPAIFLPPSVTLQVLGDNNGRLPEYPVDQNPQHYRAYLQANKNERYQLRISNNSDQRVGVVIAVDGRNIISGQKSDLKNTERMYILAPHSSSEYAGWRTSTTQVNRFYFTDAGDSYAAAWGDNSAMGVISMAVYPEQPRFEESPAASDASAPRAPSADSLNKAKEAGTGFGETKYSPIVTVQFEPMPEASEKAFLKYEWRTTLCQKHILPECKQETTPPNRFWPEDDSGFALPPPR